MPLKLLGMNRVKEKSTGPRRIPTLDKRCCILFKWLKINEMQHFGPLFRIPITSLGKMICLILINLTYMLKMLINNMLMNQKKKKKKRILICFVHSALHILSFVTFIWVEKKKREKRMKHMKETHLKKGDSLVYSQAILCKSGHSSRF